MALVYFSYGSGAQGAFSVGTAAGSATALGVGTSVINTGHHVALPVPAPDAIDCDCATPGNQSGISNINIFPDASN